MKKAIILYWSNTGNTEKVAVAIKHGLEVAGIKVSIEKTIEANDIDYFDYDLVCIGTPSIQWHPPFQVTNFLLKKFDKYKEEKKIKECSPKIAGKYALIFCTYSGPHTGIKEAKPVGLYVSQFFEHLGFTVLDKWYILGEFHGSLDRSTKGKMGDIRGKPTKEELEKISQQATKLASRLQDNLN
ncbi:MAG: flavodoxin domain-containing protein [Candidatus Bathyarchaeota archaeon]